MFIKLATNQKQSKYYFTFDYNFDNLWCITSYQIYIQFNAVSVSGIFAISFLFNCLGGSVIVTVKRKRKFY